MYSAKRCQSRSSTRVRDLGPELFVLEAPSSYRPRLKLWSQNPSPTSQGRPQSCCVTARDVNAKRISVATFRRSQETFFQQQQKVEECEKPNYVLHSQNSRQITKGRDIRPRTSSRLSIDAKRNISISGSALSLSGVKATLLAEQMVTKKSSPVKKIENMHGMGNLEHRNMRVTQMNDRSQVQKLNAFQTRANSVNLQFDMGFVASAKNTLLNSQRAQTKQRNMNMMEKRAKGVLRIRKEVLDKDSPQKKLWLHREEKSYNKNGDKTKREEHMSTPSLILSEHMQASHTQSHYHDQTKNFTQLNASFEKDGSKPLARGISEFEQSAQQRLFDALNQEFRKMSRNKNNIWKKGFSAYEVFQQHEKPQVFYPYENLQTKELSINYNPSLSTVLEEGKISQSRPQSVKMLEDKKEREIKVQKIERDKKIAGETQDKALLPKNDYINQQQMEFRKELKSIKRNMPAMLKSLSTKNKSSGDIKSEQERPLAKEENMIKDKRKIAVAENEIKKTKNKNEESVTHFRLEAWECEMKEVQQSQQSIILAEKKSSRSFSAFLLEA